MSKLNVVVLNKNDAIKSISQFFYEKPYGRFQGYLTNSFDLNLEIMNNMTEEEIDKYVMDSLGDMYDKVYPKMLISQKNLIDELTKHEKNIFNTLKDIFDIEPTNNTYTVGLMFNIIAPRYLELNSFEVNYGAPIAAQIGTIVHELIHFYFFAKLNKEFPQIPKEEYNSPHLTWLFSEIAIDAIINCTPLSKYLYGEKAAYPYFYDAKINGEDMLGIFKKFFIENDMKTYMEKSLKFINDNKKFFLELTN